MESAAQRVLRVSELLFMVFSHLQLDCKADLLEAACVSKCWSEVALDLLWETMDIKDLLLWLGPTAEIEREEEDDEDENGNSVRL